MTAERAEEGALHDGSLRIMTFHDAPTIPPPVISTERQRAEKSFTRGASDRGAVPERYLRYAAHRSARAAPVDMTAGRRKKRITTNHDIS